MYPLESDAWLEPFIQQTAAAMALTATLLGGTIPQQQPPMIGKELQSKLQAPTEDQPQIQIPSNLPSSTADKNAPIVEGTCTLSSVATDTFNRPKHVHSHDFIYIVIALLYLEDEQSRPGPLDTIVITVRDASAPDSVLVGAKIPVSKARFPIQVRLFSQNIIDLQGWSKANDVLIRATVCPAESASLPCSESEATMKAEGVAKLIQNLPGLPPGVTVRAGASLPLKGM